MPSHVFAIQFQHIWACFYSDRKRKKNTSPNPTVTSPYLTRSSPAGSFPSNDPKAMGGHWCECDKCGGKPVSKTTWYRHNAKRRRIRKDPHTASSSIGTQKNPSRDVVPNTSTGLNVKEFSPEDLEDEDRGNNIGHAARLDSVS